MSKRTKTASISAIPIIGKIFLILGFFPFLGFVVIYALVKFLFNLIFLAINQKVKGKRGASETFSDHMHELTVSVIDLFKGYVSLFAKI